MNNTALHCSAANLQLAADNVRLDSVTYSKAGVPRRKAPGNATAVENIECGTSNIVDQLRNQLRQKTAEATALSQQLKTVRMERDSLNLQLTETAYALITTADALNFSCSE